MLHVLAICCGASLGALARWRLGLWLSPGGALPWGTLAANSIGAYAIGVGLALLQQLPHLDPAWRLALGNTSLHVAGSLVLTYLGLQSVALVWHLNA